MKKKASPEIELSRPLSIDKIPAGGIEEKIVALAPEREALAKRFDLLDLSRLEATLNVDHGQDGLFEVTGSLWADVVQRCVVTLEPVPATVRDQIDVLFAPSHLMQNRGHHTDESEMDSPEPIVNGVMDLGELVSQHLAIALDPYPRKKGAKVPSFSSTAPAAESAEKPMGQLLHMVKRDGNGKKKS